MNSGSNKHSRTNQGALICCISIYLVLKYVFIYLFFVQLGLPGKVTMYPFVLHSFSLSMFSSVIGPFGGFFASGFKRAFKIKVRNFNLKKKTTCIFSC